MNENQVEQRIGGLLRRLQPSTDNAFVDRVLAAARIDAQIRMARRSALRRAAVECIAAAAVAWTFYRLSQAQPAAPGGMMSFYGTAMAGMVMLVLWAIVALPAPRQPALPSW
jgi:hypothetical protein